MANTADDLWVHGLKVCPDLDTVMYTLGGGIDDERGWGRVAETWHAKEELAAYGVEPTWFGLGDRDLATHLVRTQMLDAGYPLSAVTAALCRRWLAPVLHGRVELLPMTDDRVETHVVIDDPETDERRAVHFQEYWITPSAEVPAHAVVPIGIEEAKPGPGVLEAITETDVVLVPPSNPVVSVGTILAVPGVRDALASTRGAGRRRLRDHRRRPRPRHGPPAARGDRRRGLGRRRGRALRRPVGTVACWTAGSSTPPTPLRSPGSRPPASGVAPYRCGCTTVDATAGMVVAALDLVS